MDPYHLSLPLSHNQHHPLTPLLFPPPIFITQSFSSITSFPLYLHTSFDTLFIPVFQSFNFLITLLIFLFSNCLFSSNFPLFIFQITLSSTLPNKPLKYFSHSIFIFFLLLLLLYSLFTIPHLSFRLHFFRFPFPSLISLLLSFCCTNFLIFSFFPSIFLLSFLLLFALSSTLNAFFCLLFCTFLVPPTFHSSLTHFFPSQFFPLLLSVSFLSSLLSPLPFLLLLLSFLILF